MSVYVPGTWEAGLTVRRERDGESVVWQLLVGRMKVAEVQGTEKDDETAMVRKLLGLDETPAGS